MLVKKLSVELSNHSSYELTLDADTAERFFEEHLCEGAAESGVLIQDYYCSNHFFAANAIVAVVTIDVYETKPDFSLDECLPNNKEEE
jgi:hypothetical protein